MANIRLGVGGERKSPVLKLGLARKPLLLFRSRHRVRTEEGKSVESLVKYRIIEFSRLRLMNDLSRLVEVLQSNRVVGKILVPTYLIRCKAHGLPRHLCGFPILPLCGIDILPLGLVFTELLRKETPLRLGDLYPR
jgi:hypothetical protein